jgi:hypothetical protein
MRGRRIHAVHFLSFLCVLFKICLLFNLSCSYNKNLIVTTLSFLNFFQNYFNNCSKSNLFVFFFLNRNERKVGGL